jgi:hypothetical protein
MDCGRVAIEDYIDRFYNRQCLHQALGCAVKKSRAAGERRVIHVSVNPGTPQVLRPNIAASRLRAALSEEP